MNIPRRFVLEAAEEFEGIPVNEPVIVDNNDFKSTEVQGFARGQVDHGLLKELKARIEYHFNTVGEMIHRKNRVTWKARPAGPSKFIASASSPEVSFLSEDNGTRIRVKQSLKTDNKLYLPAVLAAIAGILMITGVLFAESRGDESIFLLFFGTLFIAASAWFSKFVNRRKQKRKSKLADLTGALQQSIERSFKAQMKGDLEEKSAKPEITIPVAEGENESELEETKLGNRLKNQ